MITIEKLLEIWVRALGSIFAPGMLKVFIFSVIASLAALVAMVVGVTAGASAILPYWLDAETSVWLTFLSGLGAMILAWFLFPGIMPVVVNFFDSKIAALIEAHDYPGVAPLEPPFWPEFWHDARFSLKAVLLNILVLPLYLVPVVNLFVFYVLNGHLLGKEFFIMVARRYRPLPEAIALRAAHRRTVFVAGVALAVLATIPVANVLAPFWGIAVMTHLYHALVLTPKMEFLKPLP